MSFENLIRDMAQFVVERHKKDLVGNPSAEALAALITMGSSYEERDKRGRRKKDMFKEDRRVKDVDELPIIDAEFVDVEDEK